MMKTSVFVFLISSSVAVAAEGGGKPSGLPVADQLGQINKGISVAKKAEAVHDLAMTDAEEQALG